ncbi:DUF5317 family protein [Micromonospora sp. DR5-3]|uniref:DUF5317 family protein n=1 Tax=unclassified Micromonospora TaxID=2617518 RepID=UPI0011D8637C|nr:MULTISPECIES: DUF5317 family protein [unclassified Micromonospora]MCW3819112.1 DUF5317 family protein [Micromonospora sp. DR5-3]TYC21845.1 hypothetical protein FXF52_24020 [Micromonospora sp. MP36]
MSLLLVGPVLVGLAAGYLTGGRLRWLAEQPLRGLWLLYAAAGVQLLTHVPPGSRLLSATAQRWLTTLVFATVGVAMLINLPHLSRPARAGIAVVLTGAALNGATILPNGHMPVAPTALHDVGAAPTGPTLDPHHTVGTATTRLAALGDILPVPWLDVVVSVGDVVLMTGVALLVAALMRGNDRRITPVEMVRD